MNVKEEILKLIDAVERHVTHTVNTDLRARVQAALATHGSAPKARKAKRGAGRRGMRHCAVCAKKGHDSRNCPNKASKPAKVKRAVLTVAKAA